MLSWWWYNWLTHGILFSPSFSWWFYPALCILPFLVLNYIITYIHNVKSSLSVSPCHDHELMPSTAYTEYCIIPRLTVSRSNLVCLRSSFGRPCCTQHSTFPKLRVNQWIESQLPSHLFSNLLPPTGPSPSTPPMLLNHGLQVHLPTCIISNLQFIFKLARSGLRCSGLPPYKIKSQLPLRATRQFHHVIFPQMQVN